MEEISRKRRILFVHSNDGNHKSRRTASKLLDSRVRRHVMIDIGASRRKPSKDLQFATIVWSLAETPKPQPSTRRSKDTTIRAEKSVTQAPTTGIVVPDIVPHAAPYVEPPILTTLSAFEKEWGEDWYSAYGFTLIMSTGKNAMTYGMLSLILL